MEPYLIPFIVIAFIVVFAAMWFLITRFLMLIARMPQQVDTFELGEFISSYGTGSGRINGVNLRNCLIVDRYTNGFLFRVWPLMGNGKMVLRDWEIASAQEKTFFGLGISSVIKTRSGTTIRLYGRLAGIINEHYLTGDPR